MGSGLDIGQMLQKKQMASPFLRNGDTETRRKGDKSVKRRALSVPVEYALHSTG